ncbi:MAG TPA: DUF2071 domain-containing protein [Ilumatobacteraceae bacterium]
MTHGPDPTVRVDHPIMTMDWSELTFIHWAFDPPAVQRLLPPGLEVQTFEDRAWVSLVPFTMRVGFPLIGVLPWVGIFPETNVRTYVTARDGTEGIWFFSLDAGRLAAVLAARMGYRLPYMWSEMTASVANDVAEYHCRRRWPGPRGARSAVEVSIGAPIAASDLTERDHFLSARWRLYSRMFATTWDARAHHQPWPLHQATLRSCDDELVRAAGLPEPSGDPVVQYSPGVNVRVSVPGRVR